VLQNGLESGDQPPALLEKEQDRGYAAYGLRAQTYLPRTNLLNEGY
jgi:hypothetical protein